MDDTINTPTLYEQVGGDEAVRLLVMKLYAKILNDDLLSPFFENISVERLRSSQHAFIIMALGGPNRYSGASLRLAHQRLVDNGLTDIHFNAVKHHMMTSMQELSVRKNLIDQTMNLVETLRNDVLCKDSSENQI